MKTVSELFEELNGRMDIDVGTVHHFSAGVYAKEMHLPAGFSAVSHAHAYDHMSILGKGIVDVTTDTDGTKRYVAPACLEVKAGVNHMITAIDDATWFCIHATDETDPDKIDRVAIEGE